MIFLFNQLHNTIHWFNFLSNKKNTYISYREWNNQKTLTRHETQSLDQINDENTKKEYSFRRNVLAKSILGSISTKISYSC